MKSVFQTLVMSTVATVMFSCSNGDVDSVNLPDELLTKGELQINVKADGVQATETSESGIGNLHFLIFKDGSKEHYQSKNFSESTTSKMFSSEPTIGDKDLAVVANWTNAVVADGETKTSFNGKTVELADQQVGNFTMVGEQIFKVNKGLNETTVNLSRLVAKVVLKSVTVEADPNVYGAIEVKRAFMMNVNGESKLQGTGVGKDVEVNNPVMHGYQNGDNYLAALSKTYSSTTPSNFYVFENKGVTDAKTMLVIEADYTKKDGAKTPVYYSIVVKKGDVAQVLRNNVYTLTATIKRPGSIHPEIPSDHGDLEVSIAVDEWIYNAEQGESFE